MRRWTLVSIVVPLLAFGLSAVTLVHGQPELETAVGEVTQVEDGDAFEVRYILGGMGLPTTIRPYLVDVPKDSTGQECFGRETAAYTRNILLERTVWLRHQGKRSLGRLLAFVFLDRDHQALLQAISISQGFARMEIRHPEGEQFRDRMERLEQDAMMAGRGLWGACEDRPGSSPSGVVINELELNPKGADSGGQWVELFNARDEKVNVGCWRVTANRGGLREFRIPSNWPIVPRGIALFLLPEAFLENRGEVVKLLDMQGTLIDETPARGLDDERNDNRCWARVPDGGDEWRFQTCSPAGPN